MKQQGPIHIVFLEGLSHMQVYYASMTLIISKSRCASSCGTRYLDYIFGIFNILCWFHGFNYVFHSLKFLIKPVFSSNALQFSTYKNPILHPLPYVLTPHSFLEPEHSRSIPRFPDFLHLGQHVLCGCQRTDSIPHVSNLMAGRTYLIQCPSQTLLVTV